MSSQTGWLIVATEGATVDGRIITTNWIKDMAELYSQEEYTALIWPEHYRSQWTSFQGKNWGTVDEVKAEKKNGKLRLFAKITGNHYLTEANKDGQKLFTSIEPDPDYRTSGRCYLMGLAVTDSPASSGTTRLKFAMGNKECEHEYSQLEPFIFEPNLNEESEETSFFKIAKEFFSRKSTSIDIEQKETRVTEEQLKAALTESLKPFNTRLDDFEKKFTTIQTPPVLQTEAPIEPLKTEKTEPFTTEQFSKVISDALTPLVDKFSVLETKFNSLLQEVPDQRPSGEGADVNANEQDIF